MTARSIQGLNYKIRTLPNIDNLDAVFFLWMVKGFFLFGHRNTNTVFYKKIAITCKLPDHMPALPRGPDFLHVGAAKGFLGNPLAGGGPEDVKVVKDLMAFFRHHSDTFAYDPPTERVSLQVPVSNVQAEAGLDQRPTGKLQDRPTQAIKIPKSNIPPIGENKVLFCSPIKTHQTDQNEFVFRLTQKKYQYSCVVLIPSFNQHACFLHLMPISGGLQSCWARRTHGGICVAPVACNRYHI